MRQMLSLKDLILYLLSAHISSNHDGAIKNAEDSKIYTSSSYCLYEQHCTVNFFNINLLESHFYIYHLVMINYIVIN
jgi:hypothetical protein